MVARYLLLSEHQTLSNDLNAEQIRCLDHVIGRFRVGKFNGAVLAKLFAKER